MERKVQGDERNRNFTFVPDGQEECLSETIQCTSHASWRLWSLALEYTTAWPSDMKPPCDKFGWCVLLQFGMPFVWHTVSYDDSLQSFMDSEDLVGLFFHKPTVQLTLQTTRYIEKIVIVYE